MMKCKILLLLFFCLIGLGAQAQVPSNTIGLNPYRLKWNQINTDKVQVVFPRGLEAQGQRVANLVHYMWDNGNESIGNRMKKVSIFLQNQSTVPNAFVTVGPFRSEFYLTPPQFNDYGMLSWVDLLTIHEYRHVKQFSNANRGITRLVKTVLGSWAWGGMAGTAMPRWYWEGDAVGAETALSNGGRGRLPQFDMEYKSLILSNKRYGYEKAQATSLRDFVPNHYNLGYYMTTFARRRFGEDIWQKTTEDAVRYRGLFYPLSRSLNRRTGFRTPELYRAMRQDLDSMWKAEAQKLELTPSTKKNQLKKDRFTSYQFPFYMEDGSIVAEKSSFNQIRTYYRIYPDGREVRLTQPGINVESNATLSVSNNLLCWAEFGYGERWGYQNFSVIRTYSMINQKKYKLSSRSRYFAPALSSRADKIVAVEIKESLDNQLVILNTQSGEVIKKLPNPDSLLLSYPRWSDDDQHLIAVALKNEKQWLVKINAETGTYANLIPPSTYQISYPCVKGDYVYFSGAHTGINNIFAVKMGESDLYQVTSVSLGAFQPAVSKDGNKLIYSEFTAMGYDLMEMELKPDTWKKWTPVSSSPSEITYYKSIAEQEGGSITQKAGSQRFEVKKYNKWSGLINPHSILPYFLPPVTGVRLLMDNKFSTLSGELAAYYNNNEKEMTYSANLSYAELYPIINVGYDYGQRSRSNLDFAALAPNDTTVFVRSYTARWTESDFSVGLALPFNLTKGTFFQNLRLRADYHWINLETDNLNERVNNFTPDTIRLRRPDNVNRFRNLFNRRLATQNIQALDLQFRFSTFQRTALQNILPRWGFLLDIRQRQTLNGGQNQGKVFNFRSDLYIPGFMRNHNFYVNFAYQRENFLDVYKFRNFFFYPRGTGSVSSDEITKIGFNYSLPLLYPDMAISSLAFIKRIKANFFYDFAQANLTSWRPFIPRQDNISSMGVELTFDVRFLRLIEADLGFRYSYVPNARYTPNGQNHQFQFLLFRLGI
ncbi:MAG: hypothetical protein MUE85_10965 [Microscillaceae bacterium]|jgi:hypothetical protein|nr:hypothetical protein [Microscillaceae bacterium]